MDFCGLFYAIVGYLLGSILFADVVGKLLFHKDISENSADKNPGVFNAFKNGGFFCGAIALIGDLAKGFFPVFLYLRQGQGQGQSPIWLGIVLASPVIGHIFPIFRGFKGGKGIATSFGVLLGFFPNLKPLLIFAFVFIFFSFVLSITPDIYKTIITYPITLGLLFALGDNIGLGLGFLFISVGVLFKLITSKEEKEELKVRLLWKH